MIISERRVACSRSSGRATTRRRPVFPVHGHPRTSARRPVLRAAPVGVALLLTLLVAGCGGNSTTSSGPGTNATPTTAGFPVTVPACHGNLTFDHPLKRVVTLGTDPELAVAAAGGTGLIVKAFTYQGAPLGPYADVLSHVPVEYVPTSGVPSGESVIAERPDLVVGYDLSSHADLGAALNAAGLRILTPNCRCSTVRGKQAITFADVYQQIDQLGQVLGTRAAADAEIAKLKSRQAAAEQRAGAGTSTTKRTAAIVALYSGLTVDGPRTLDGAMLDRLGLTNVYGDVNKEGSFETSYETLIAKNPGVIIIAANNPGPQGAQHDVQEFEAGPGAQKLSAVKQGHVIPVFFGYLAGGPLAIDGLEKIAAALDAFK